MKLIDKKFLSNAHVNYVAQSLGIGLGFISVTLLVKFGGLGLYGMMTVMLALGATVTNLVSFRTNEALVRFYKRGASKNNQELQYFSVSAGICLDILTGLVFLTIIRFFAEAIGLHLLKSTTEKDAILLFSFMASANFLRGTGYGLLTAEERFNTISVLGVLEQGLKVACLGLGLWNLEDIKLYSVILLIFLSSVPFTIYYVYISLEQLYRKPIRRWCRKKWIRLYWGFSMNTFISATLKSGHKNLDSVILSYFSSPAIVGLYNLFKQFLSPLNMLAVPYASQIYPKFVNALATKSVESVMQAIEEGSKSLLKQGVILMIIVVPIAFVYFLWNDINISGADYLAFFIMLTASFIVQQLWWNRAFSLAWRPIYSIYSNFLSSIITLMILPFFLWLSANLITVGLVFMISVILQKIFWYFIYRKFLDTEVFLR